MVHATDHHTTKDHNLNLRPGMTRFLQQWAMITNSYASCTNSLFVTEVKQSLLAIQKLGSLISNTKVAGRWLGHTGLQVYVH
jgi:hypothetical protein